MGRGECCTTTIRKRGLGQLTDKELEEGIERVVVDEWWGEYEHKTVYYLDGTVLYPDGERRKIRTPKKSYRKKKEKQDKNTDLIKHDEPVNENSCEILSDDEKLIQGLLEGNKKAYNEIGDLVFEKLKSSNYERQHV